MAVAAAAPASTTTKSKEESTHAIDTSRHLAEDNAYLLSKANYQKLLKAGWQATPKHTLKGFFVIRKGNSRFLFLKSLPLKISGFDESPALKRNDFSN